MNQKISCLAEIVSSHGVRGAVKIKTYTIKPENIVKYGLLKDKTEKNFYEIRIIKIISSNLVIAKINDINNRDDADKLRNIKLYIDTIRLPELHDENEFYYHSLIGLKIIDFNNNTYGYVKSLHNFGAGDIVEIILIDKKISMLPFTKKIFPTINIEEKYMTIFPPDFIGRNDE